LNFPLTGDREIVLYAKARRRGALTNKLIKFIESPRGLFYLQTLSQIPGLRASRETSAYDRASLKNKFTNSDISVKLYKCN